MDYFPRHREIKANTTRASTHPRNMGLMPLALIHAEIVSSMPAPCGLFFARVCHYQMNLLKYLQAAGVPETLQAQALESLGQAREKARKVSPYKWSAPLVIWITWSLLR